MLFVDEAHAIGILGSEGRGLCNKVSSPITMISGTFGKAFGSGGAFLAGSKNTMDYLLQTSGAFRYTTALSPALAAAALEALRLIQNNPDWGKDLQYRSNHWRSILMAQNWRCLPGNSPIIPLIIGSDQKALNCQSHLEKEGLLTVAIRPPTVPEGTSRLRLILRRDLPDGTLDRLIASLKEFL